MVHLITAEQKDPAVVAAAMRLLRPIVLDDPAAHASLVAAGGLQLVHEWMEPHREVVPVQLCALLLLQAILAGKGPVPDSQHGIVLTEAEGSLALFPQVAQVQVAVFTLLRALVQRQSSHAVSISETGLLGQLVRGMLKCLKEGFTPAQQDLSTAVDYAGPLAVVQQGCLFLAALLREEPAMMRALFSLGGLDLVARLLRRKQTVLEELAPALTLLCELLLLPEAMTQAAGLEIHLVVLEVVRSMWGEAEVAEVGCHALWLLCTDNMMAAQLANVGLMGTLVAAVNQFGDHLELFLHVMRAMTNILAVLSTHLAASGVLSGVLMCRLISRADWWCKWQATQR